MSGKRGVNERGYCESCERWLSEGEQHDWEKHPATIHGDIDRARERRYGGNDE